MRNIRYMVLLACVQCCLVGCEDKTTYSYLMRHPRVLMAEVEYCKALNEKTSAQTTQCDTTMYAAANFASLINAEHQDPEKFGQRLIEAEWVSVRANQEVQAAQQALADLQAKQASADALKAAQDKLAAAKKTLHDNNENIAILLAVIGLNSPN